MSFFSHPDFAILACFSNVFEEFHGHVVFFPLLPPTVWQTQALSMLYVSNAVLL